MRHLFGHGLVLSGSALLALSIATGAGAATVTTDSHGIRHETITVGPVQAPETVSGRSGTGTYFYTYSYINARDAINAMLETAHMSTAYTGDVTNLVADVKGGASSLQSLSNAILGPNGVGDSSLPAGFFGNDRGTWQSMGMDSGSWQTRYNDAVRAMGGACGGINDQGSAESCIQSELNSGNLGSWNYQSIANAIGWNFSKASWTSPEDDYLRGIEGGGPPHFVPSLVPSPGQGLEFGIAFAGDGSSAWSGPNPGQTYVASAFFLSQAQRWVNAEATLAALGAGNLAAEALNFARDDAGILSDYGDPLVLDLNHNGIVDVTGRSSAVVRARKNMGFVKTGSVRFDLYDTGPLQMEWIKNGDGFLVDATKAKEAIAQGQPLNGRDLMGDAEGAPGGFAKLASYDHQHAGKIVGPDLDRLAVWINKAGDGRYHSGELYSMKQLGITEIDYRSHFKYDKDHEPLEQAGFVQHGKRYTVQEVWFAFEPQHLASKGGY